jgi:hypothetical protein
MENFESKQPQKIEGTPGQHIYNFAQQLIDTAKKRNEEVVGTFNGIDLVVSPESDLSADDLVQSFHEESEKRAEAYRKSPEGIKAAKEAEERKHNMQEKANQLIESLGSLDFSDYESVLEWMCNFQEASDHIGVSFDKSQVISTFKDHGFDIGVNTGDDFNGEDAENFAKYLVGKALDGINTVGAPHKIVHKFTNDWKQKFGRQKQADDKKIEELRKGL